MKIYSPITSPRCKACGLMHLMDTECPEEISNNIRRGEAVSTQHAIIAITYQATRKPLPWWRKLIGWLKEKL